MLTTMTTPAQRRAAKHQILPAKGPYHAETVTTPAQRRAAKHQILVDLQEGYSVQETHQRAPLLLHPVTIYRLQKRLQADPLTALDDGRHGHPIKLRGEVSQWVLEFCRNAPHTASHVVQETLHKRFGLLISICQLNRFRAAHGISSRRRGKKAGTSPNRGTSA